MMTLLTGQPGNGKTSHVINQIRQALKQGRLVYTVGIPKLKLPVITMSRKELDDWCVREDKKDPNDEDEVVLLKNIVEGSLIVVDEAQKSFMPSGTNVPEKISYLSEHRHHGLDFIIITQYPFLVHQTVRALITKHWHIRSTWKGRKLHEWPEWQERPQSQSALALAATSSYSIDSSTFEEYESASIHTVVKHKRPLYVYFIFASFFLLPVGAYFSFHRIYDKTQLHIQTLPKEAKHATTFESSNYIATPSFPAPPLATLVSFENVQVVSSHYDWAKIGACVSSKKRCSCYGDVGNSIVVPDSVCRAAVVAGWSGRPNVQTVASPQKSNFSQVVYSARNDPSDPTHSK